MYIYQRIERKLTKKNGVYIQGKNKSRERNKKTPEKIEGGKTPTEGNYICVQIIVMIKKTIQKCFKIKEEIGERK